jgi:hypothetical protein
VEPKVFDSVEIVGGGIGASLEQEYVVAGNTVPDVETNSPPEAAGSEFVKHPV